MTGKREKAPALYKKGPSYMMRIRYQENGVTLRAAFKVGVVGEPLALAQRNAKVVRAMVKAGKVDEVPAFLGRKIQSTELPAGNQMTVQELADELIELEQTDNPRLAKDLESHYRIYVKQGIGRLDLASISPAVLRENVFQPMADRGLAQATLLNPKRFLRKLFKFAIDRQLVTRNPVDDMWRMPRAKKDNRPYVLPTDAEFVLVVNYLLSRPRGENVDGVGALELATLLVVSRFIGGQRASDLHAWQWTDIDQETWMSCVVRRPKTERGENGELIQSTNRTIHRINEDERAILRQWWAYEETPKTGFVFPTRTGARAGQQKKGMGYAESLRTAVRRALGIEVSDVRKKTISRRYKDGSSRAMTFETTKWVQARKPVGRELTLLEGDDQYRPLTMHTMRRAYATHLSLAGWSTAQMRTAGGWKSDTMPARYDLSAQQVHVDAKGTTPRLMLVSDPEPAERGVALG